MIPNNLHRITCAIWQCAWLGEQAEELGVEVYPGFPASEVG